MIKKDAWTGDEKIVSPFTDDDLKRLKEDNRESPLLGKHPWIITFNLEALLARLQAAEKCCIDAWNIEDVIEVPEGLGLTSQSVLVREINEFKESYKAWRKAAGK